MSNQKNFRTPAIRNSITFLLSRLKSTRAVVALMLFLNLLVPLTVAPVRAQTRDKAPQIEAVRYLTWWFHDATGYHPAIWLGVENVSGQDLTGVSIKFQARFTNLRNGYVNVARDEMRREFKENEQIRILLKGPRSYDLPIDQNLWPKMECKVMARVGDVEDEGTQNLLLTKLNSITMSLDEAQMRLFKQPSLRNIRNSISERQQREAPEKPLVAMAETLNGRTQAKPQKSLADFLSSKVIPGLGDDFYEFERKFGRPVEFDPSNPKWTWATFRHQDPPFTVIVGSRGQTGKADLIVTSVASGQLKGETEIVNLAKAMSGKFRAEQTTRPEHSVRYLSTGRLEYGTLSAKNYRAAYFTPGESPSSTKAFNIVVTRMPGNLLNILRQELRGAKLLKFLVPVIGEGGS